MLNLLPWHKIFPKLETMVAVDVSIIVATGITGAIASMIILLVILQMLLLLLLHTTDIASTCYYT